MLNYQILESKPTIKLSDDSEEMYDLLADNVFYANVVNSDILIVNEYYVARPDLISFAVYGDDMYTDLLCKINNISNPFEVNEGDIIILPYYEEMVNHINYNMGSCELASDSDKIADNIKNAQKLKNETRSPAQQVVGDSNYIIDKENNIVYY